MKKTQVRLQRIFCAIMVAAAIALIAACRNSAGAQAEAVAAAQPVESVASPISITPEVKRLIEAAREQTGYTFAYDPAYKKIAYPGGDVPLDRGVCSDVIVRAFRKVGVDLQKEVHLDMKRSFSAYPKKWGLAAPDTNIDHRRVPNLMTYFKRKGKELSITRNGKDYLPGDIVAWDLGGGITHIGLMTDQTGPSRNFQIVHNIGAGARLEDLLFSWQIIGHYRYF